jgi:uncharacterized protein with HEPN domain
MKPEIKKHLFDIKTSIDSVEEYLSNNKTILEFQNNKLLRRAIEREIEIIGEAMNRILRIYPECKIKNARTIVDTRNYDTINNKKRNNSNRNKKLQRFNSCQEWQN